MRRWMLVLCATALPTLFGASPVHEEFDPPVDVIEVKMVDISPTEFAFEPAEFEVTRGQTVRFVMTGTMPHNVEFKDVPEDTELGAAKMGSFLVQQGQTYEIVIDDRFANGEHRFVCTPHEFMGMKGAMTVTPQNTSSH